MIFSILAHFPSDNHLDRTLDTALPLVRSNDAHLIGLHVIPRVPAMYGLMAAELPQSIIAQQQEVLARQADQARSAQCAKHTPHVVGCYANRIQRALRLAQFTDGLRARCSQFECSGRDRGHLISVRESAGRSRPG